MSEKKSKNRIGFEKKFWLRDTEKTSKEGGPFGREDSVGLEKKIKKPQIAMDLGFSFL